MSPKTGMTLIELLSAIAIALLVIAVVFSMHHTVVRIVGSQDARLDGPVAAAHALEQMIRDLHAVAPPDEDAACAFLLGPAQDGTPGEIRLQFCAATSPAEDDLRWFEFERVLYRFRPGEDQDGVLSRESVPLAGPGSDGPATTNILVARLERLEMESFNGNDWSPEWTEAELPRGLRVAVVSHGRTYTADVLIPAANPVTSAVIRAAPPPP